MPLISWVDTNRIYVQRIINRINDEQASQFTGLLTINHIDNLPMDKIIVIGGECHRLHADNFNPRGEGRFDTSDDSLIISRIGEANSEAVCCQCRYPLATTHNFDDEKGDYNREANKHDQHQASNL